MPAEEHRRNRTTGGVAVREAVEGDIARLVDIERDAGEDFGQLSADVSAESCVPEAVVPVLGDGPRGECRQS